MVTIDAGEVIYPSDFADFKLNAEVCRAACYPGRRRAILGAGGCGNLVKEPARHGHSGVDRQTRRR